MYGLDQAFIALSNAFLELISAIALVVLPFYLISQYCHKHPRAHDK